MTACAPQGYEAASGIASQTVQDIACQDKALETKLWDGLKTYLLEQKTLPDADTFKTALHEQLKILAAKNPHMTSKQKADLQAALDQLVETILEDAPAGERVKTPEQLLLLLSAIDVGDRSTPFRAYMQDKVQGRFAQVQKAASVVELSCENTDAGTDGNSSAGLVDTGSGSGAETDSGSGSGSQAGSDSRDYNYHLQQAQREGIPLATFGGRWAFATAYQSCQSVQLPSMNSQSTEISGISIVGKHSDGVGSKRMIASLSQVQNTHTYIRDMNTYGEGCFNVRQNPLIYDYGGKPYATTAADSPIDLFKNNGDGTSVLGIDCSGFVFTALATAGLRLKEGRALKASDSWAWGSSTYVEPQNNGLTCLNKITVTPTSSLQSGDIVAVYGHVLLIDKVGADPFGIASAKSEGDCAKITSNQFNFVVSQSSPNKGGIGINYFEARDYLPTSSKMKDGLEKYAKAACVAKVTGKSSTPNIGTLSVVRHKGTEACKAPRVKMARESCIQSCSSLIR